MKLTNTLKFQLGILKKKGINAIMVNTNSVLKSN